MYIWYAPLSVSPPGNVSLSNVVSSNTMTSGGGRNVATGKNAHDRACMYDTTSETDVTCWFKWLSHTRNSTRRVGVGESGQDNPLTESF
jgi:hypothetical protein